MAAAGGPACNGSAMERKIWVGIRIRPGEGREKEVWHANDTKTLRYSGPVQNVQANIFSFDRVWGPGTSNENVYSDACRSIVKSATEGFNGTIFAYGQTAAGKTYTINSVMEQATRDVFEVISRTPGRDFSLRVSATEIYNEVVYDLLSKGPATTLKLLQGDDPEKSAMAQGLTEEPVLSAVHLQTILREVDKRRHVGEHGMNERSSRSHLIVRLVMESHDTEDTALGELDELASPESNCSEGGDSPLAANPTIVSALSFVDLAGSERAGRTQAEGIRLKEGGHINRSLLTLGTVIRKLSEGDKGYIPYRDSKLTRMLQHSLGGNARTAIICTVAPSARDAEPSRSTVYFAEQAKRITNRAHVNTVLDERALLRQMQAEIRRLQEQLTKARDGGEGAAPAQVATALAREKEALTLRDAAEKRLRGLEKLILRAPATGGLERRMSWSDDTPAKQLLPKPTTGVRASWAPGQKMPTAAALDTAAPGGGRAMGPLDLPRGRSGEAPPASVLLAAPPSSGPRPGATGSSLGGYLLLDLLRPGLSRKRAASRPTGAPAASGTSSAAFSAPGAAAEGPMGQGPQQGGLPSVEEEVRRITDVPLDAESERALAELRLEVRCLRGPGGLEVAVPAEERIDRMRREIEDIEERRRTAAQHEGGGATSASSSFAGEAGAADAGGLAVTPVSINEETLEAFQAELARAEGQRECEVAAEGALAALSSRLEDMPLAPLDLGVVSAAAEEESAARWVLTARDTNGSAGTPGGRGERTPSPEVLVGPSPSPRRAPNSTPGSTRRFISRIARSPSSSPMLGSPDSVGENPMVTPDPPAAPGGGGAAGSESKENSPPAYSPWSSGDGDLPNLGSIGAKSTASARAGGESAGEERIVGRVRQAVRDFTRMQRDFKSAAERDVGAIRAALDGYREQSERLECQKRLLLAQVLKLELQVDQGAKDEGQLQGELSNARRKLAGARQKVKELEAVVSAAQGIAGRAADEAASAGEQAAGWKRAAEAARATVAAKGAAGGGMIDSGGNDSWANSDATLELGPELLIAKIAQLWESLSVPLLHRSRFFLAFRARDRFYLDAEHRRLNWLASQPGAAGPSAERELVRERSFLVKQLKRRFSPSARQQLFMSWAVPLESKRRKGQVVGKLWGDAMDKLKTPNKRVACAQLVLQLYGEEEGESVAYDLVFPRNHAGAAMRSAGILDRLRASIAI